MTEERKPDGWFIALKDVKTGKVNELAIMRTPEAAADYRQRGYIVRPFIYLSDADEKPRTCETCVNSRAIGFGKYACKNIDSLAGVPVIGLPNDHYCKHWEKKDECPNS